MISQELFSSFKNYIKGSPLDVSFRKTSKTGKLSVLTEGGLDRSTPTYANEIRAYCGLVPPNDLELLKTLYTENGCKAFVADFVAMLPEYDPQTSQQSDDEMPKEIEGLLLNCDLLNPKKLFLTDSEDRISPVHPKVYMAWHGIREEIAPKRSRLVYSKYSPREEQGVKLGKVPGYDQLFNVLNVYVAPRWKEVKDTKELPSPLFFKLINHLFPIETDRRFALYWIRKSLVARAKTYLMLCGVGGVGKNRLKLLMTSLHGASNSVDGKKSTLTTQFNSQLQNNTLMWFDELRFTESEENVMKEMPNETASIEAKFQDSTFRTELHGSYIISNNKPRDNYISMDARKFCPVVLNTQRLETSMTLEEISEFSNKVDVSHPAYDNEFVAKIGYWIINNCDSDEWPLDEYKGKMFHILTHTSMSKWQKRTVRIMTYMKYGGPEFKTNKVSVNKFKEFISGGYGSMDSESFDFLFESINKYNNTNLICPELSSVEAFLESYRDLDGHKICEVKRIEDKLEGNFVLTRLNVETVKTNNLELVFDDDEDIDAIDAL